MLALLPLIVLNASPKLFCLPCALPPVLACPFQADARVEFSFRVGHRSSGESPLDTLLRFGLEGYGEYPSGESAWSGNGSIEVRRCAPESMGNLEMGTRVIEAVRVE